MHTIFPHPTLSEMIEGKRAGRLWEGVEHVSIARSEALTSDVDRRERDMLRLRCRETGHEVITSCRPDLSRQILTGRQNRN